MHAERMSKQAAEDEAVVRGDSISPRADDILSALSARLAQVRAALPLLKQVDVKCDQLRYLVRGTAEAEVDLHDARARHADAAAQAGVIQVRIAAVQARKDELRAKLKSGELGDREAGALLAAAEDDLSDLQTMYAEAVSAAAALKPSGAEVILSQACTILDQAERLAATDIVRDHIAACEEALLETLRRSASVLHAAGKSASLGFVWTPSNELRRAVQFNVLPSLGHPHG